MFINISDLYFSSTVIVCYTMGSSVPMVIT